MHDVYETSLFYRNTLRNVNVIDCSRQKVAPSWSTGRFIPGFVRFLAPDHGINESPSVFKIKSSIQVFNTVRGKKICFLVNEINKLQKSMSNFVPSFVQTCTAWRPTLYHLRSSFVPLASCLWKIVRMRLPVSQEPLHDLNIWPRLETSSLSRTKMSDETYLVCLSKAFKCAWCPALYRLRKASESIWIGLMSSFVPPN